MSKFCIEQSLKDEGGKVTIGRDGETFNEKDSVTSDQLGSLPELLKDIGLPNDCSVLISHQAKNLSLKNPHLWRWHPR